MDAWPLGASGTEQHWSCQTGWGGCIRSSSPSTGVNCRTGTFTQPLTLVLTSKVMIKVRGQAGPLWSGTSRAPPVSSSSASLYSFPSFPPSDLKFLSFFFLLFPYHCCVWPSLTLSFCGRDQLRHPISWECAKENKKKKINSKDEWRPGGPIRKRRFLFERWESKENRVPARSKWDCWKCATLNKNTV